MSCTKRRYRNVIKKASIIPLIYTINNHITIEAIIVIVVISPFCHILRLDAHQSTSNGTPRKRQMLIINLSERIYWRILVLKHTEKFMSAMFMLFFIASRGLSFSSTIKYLVKGRKIEINKIISARSDTIIIMKILSKIHKTQILERTTINIIGVKKLIIPLNSNIGKKLPKPFPNDLAPFFSSSAKYSISTPSPRGGRR